MEVIEYWKDGKLFKSIQPEKENGHLGIHVPQAHLLSVIIEEAKKYDNFSLLTSTKVVDLLEDENGQFIGIKGKKHGKEIVIYSSYIIGADGRYSIVRKKAGIETSIRKHGYDLLWAKVPAPEGWQPSIKMADVDGYQLALFTQTNGYVQIGWNIEPRFFFKNTEIAFPNLRAKIGSSFSGIGRDGKKHITSWDDFVLLDVHSNFTEVWKKNNVLLIGDACHTMTPTGAFGLNSALVDADRLAECFEQGDINELKLIQCEQKRKEEVKKLLRLQIEKEKNFSEQFIILN
ncbi:FAD-dependent monooxygenase [Ureibacillus sp. FSL K6-8385]|uniref:FAD-dependent monooxygenase n=1 Tax=Ureibacillus sp. FSL K6-8385 TaxID=2954684 RepID=UPI0031586327